MHADGCQYEQQKSIYERDFLALQQIQTEKHFDVQQWKMHAY